MRILSIHMTHDASCSVINDGKIEFYGKEERFSRIKKDNHPFLTLDVIKSLNLGKIDYAVYHTPSNSEESLYVLYAEYVRKIFNVHLENYSDLNHHKVHATLAFCNSGFDEALSFVIDRNGSILFIDRMPSLRESESVFYFSKEALCIEEIYKSFWLYNEMDKSFAKSILSNQKTNTDIKIHGVFGIVKAYEAGTTLIDQNPLENGKTMGLSSYSDKTYSNSFFIDGSPISNKFSHIDNRHMDLVSCINGMEDDITHEVTPANYKLYADIAKELQLETQESVLNLIKYYVNKTGVKNVCISGGYGLNVVANQYYLENTNGLSFYFEPLSDDSGVSIGAAMLKHFEIEKKFPNKICTPFFHYFNNEEDILDKTCTKIYDADVTDVANLLVNGKSVGLFHGHPESGPRALGHRSILFDPRNSNSKNIINEIKMREWYRPFAGVILESELEKYFHTNGVSKSEYMTINFKAKRKAKKFPGILHVDNTCRLQTVSSGCLFDILNIFNKKTDCPVLLNTSMNLAGEPLVQTKKEALDMLNNSKLDYIFFVDDKKMAKNKNI